MKKKITATFILMALTACTTVQNHEVINGQTVAVGRTSSGDVIKRFPYVGGTSLTVRASQTQATVTHVLEYPATDAQKRGFVQQATGCAAGMQVSQYNQMAQGGITLTTYLLAC